MIEIILRKNRLIDYKVLDQCFEFDIHGFELGTIVQIFKNDEASDLVFKNN